MCRIVFVLVCAVDNATQLLAEKYCLELHSPDTPVSVVEFVDLSAASQSPPVCILLRLLLADNPVSVVEFVDLSTALSRHLSAFCCPYFLQSRCVRRLALTVAINEFARLGSQLRVRADKLLKYAVQTCKLDLTQHCNRIRSLNVCSVNQSLKLM